MPSSPRPQVHKLVTCVDMRRNYVGSQPCPPADTTVPHLVKDVVPTDVNADLVFIYQCHQSPALKAFSSDRLDYLELNFKQARLMAILLTTHHLLTIDYSLLTYD